MNERDQAKAIELLRRWLLQHGDPSGDLCRVASALLEETRRFLSNGDAAGTAGSSGAAGAVGSGGSADTQGAAGAAGATGAAGAPKGRKPRQPSLPIAPATDERIAR